MLVCRENIFYTWPWCKCRI